MTIHRTPLAGLPMTLLAACALVSGLVACSTTVQGNSLAGAPASQSNSMPHADTSGSDPAPSASSGGDATSPARSPGAASPDGMAHPCSLLTQPEAEALAGTKLIAGTEAGQGDDKTLCQYVGPTTGPLAQVEVLVGDGAKKQLDIDRDILTHAFTTASGVGDEAYQEDDNLFVRKADVWVSVNLSRLNDPAQNVKALQVAGSQIAARLGSS